MRSQWLTPLTRNATQQAARQTTSHAGCVKIVRSFYRIPWHRSHGYDLRHPAHDHHDLFSNAIRVDLITASLICTTKSDLADKTANQSEPTEPRQEASRVLTKSLPTG